MRLSGAFVVCALVALAAFANAQQPVFEHNMDVDKKSAECEVCQAVVFELAKVLLPNKASKKGREVEVFQALDKICDVEKFRLYEFAPPTMIKSCHTLMGKAEEKLEQAFIKSNDQAAIRKKVCLDGGYCKALWSAEQEAKARGEFGQSGSGDDKGGEAAILAAREAAKTDPAVKAAYEKAYAARDAAEQGAATPTADVDENGVPYDGAAPKTEL